MRPGPEAKQEAQPKGEPGLVARGMSRSDIRLAREGETGRDAMDGKEPQLHDYK
ncbi:MAG TPA: hypothetical protein VGV16_01945 [Gammaproteobacteria bacterium]|nr:hypothetical protein [Gammaproteobacteria bacterium]